MAWYDIHHSCGHATEQQIYGTNVRDERQQQADRLGRRPCPRCVQQQYDDDNRGAAERAKQAGWPALTGSAKQIAWAQSIRSRAVDGLGDEVRMAYAWTGDMVALAATLLLQDRASASWWIDHRNQRCWLDLVENDPVWVEAVAKLPPEATFEALQLEFANCGTHDDLTHVLRRVDMARRVGQLTDAQIEKCASLAHRTRLRLEGE